VLSDPTQLARHCDRSRLPSELASAFVQLPPDEATEKFFERLRASRPGRLKTVLHRALCRWMSDFDADGVLGMYAMHLASTDQWARLLGSGVGGRLLDVGAGSGDVTTTLAPLFTEVVTTELSKGMARRLRSLGFRVEELDVAGRGAPDPFYDVVSCLNVIDRCPLPLSLIRRCRDALRQDGRLVVSVPLPYRPHVYVGPRALEPLEDLDITAPDWESSAVLLYRRVLAPLGLKVERFTRLPYLSGGDAQRAVYELDASVWICRRALDSLRDARGSVV
jgi:SAM-dependent methyltransferase